MAARKYVARLGEQAEADAPAERAGTSASDGQRVAAGAGSA